MGFLDQVKAFLRREAKDAKEWIDDSVASGNAALERAERRTSADPQERLAATLEDIDEGEDAFADIRAKAEGAAVAPAAAAELAGEEATFDPTDDPVADADDVLGGAAPTTGLAMARLWVRAGTQADGLLHGFHTVVLEDTAVRVTGESWFDEGTFETAVADQPGVDAVVVEDRRLVHVSGPELTAAEARRAVAAVLAPRIGEDWQERLG